MCPLRHCEIKLASQSNLREEEQDEGREESLSRKMRFSDFPFRGFNFISCKFDFPTGTSTRFLTCTMTS